MQKWECCLLKQHKVKECWVDFFSQGKKEKASRTLGEVVAWLGDNGWEAVNYNVNDNLILDSAYSKWPHASSSMTTRGLDIAREFLFKRPTER